MDLKKFLFRLIVFVLSPVLIYLIVPRSIYQSSEYTIWENVFFWTDTVAKTNSASKNVLLGDSRSLIGFNANSVRAVNLSLGGSTPVEGYYLLNKMLKRNVKIDTLYLSYGPFHLYAQDCFYDRSMYYGFIDDSYLEQVMKLSQSLNDSSYFVKMKDFYPNASAYSKVLEKTRCIKLSRYAFDFYEAYRFGVKNVRSKKSKSTVIKDGYAKKEFNEIGALAYKNLTPEYTFYKKRETLIFSKTNMVYLDSIRYLCEKHKIQNYYIVMPLPEQCMLPPKVYIENFLSLVNTKFNVLSDSIYYPNHYFYDASHLNMKGVEKISSKVNSIVDDSIK